MVGYVLLISIAVALSTAVFFYLKLYLPSDKQDCYQDINLVIDSVGCNIYIIYCVYCFYKFH